MNIKERILEIVEIQGIKKIDFFDKVGITSAGFRGKAAESALSSDALAKILTLMPEVNVEYLLLGTGEKFKRPAVIETSDMLNNCNKTKKLYQDLLNVKDQENKILRDMLDVYENAPMRHDK